MWKERYRQRVLSKHGFVETYYILEGPTCPGMFYVGPALDDLSPRYNPTRFYHRTEDDALCALVRMTENA